ncbi:MAG: FecR domain-containing protein [Planctomycetota bacterium]
MTADELHDLLERHAEASLGEADAARLLQRLREDPQLRERAAEHRRMRLLLATALGRGAPLPVAERVLALRAAAACGERRRFASRVIERSGLRRRMLWRPIFVVAAALCLALAGGWWWYAAVDRPAVRVEACVGRVLAGQTALRPGAACPPGTAITLAASERLELRCADTSYFVLRGPGRFAQQWAEQRRWQVDAGTLEAIVAPQAPALPASLVTPQAQVRVLGTRLTVSTDPIATRVAVTEGRVRLRRRPDGSEPRIIAAGATGLVMNRAAASAMATELQPHWPPALAAWDGADLPASWRPLAVHAADPTGRLVGLEHAAPLTLSLDDSGEDFRIPLPAWDAGSIEASWDITAHDTDRPGVFRDGRVVLDLADSFSQPAGPDAGQQESINLTTRQTTVQLLWQRVRVLPTGSWYAVRKRLAGVDLFSGWIFVGHDRMAFQVTSSKPATVTLTDLRIVHVDPDAER